MLKPLSVAATIACGLMFCTPSTASSATTWSQFLANTSHTSYVADPAITSGGAPRLGVKWMANLYGPDLGSPVVAFNSTLNKTVVYVGDERADVFAVDASTGKLLWSNNVGLNDKLRASPLVASDGTIWVGTAYNPTLYKLNGATGKVECSVKTALAINGSPMEVTPAGGVDTIFWDTIDGSSVPGPTIATRESDCSQIFSFTNYRGNAGPWTTPAYSLSKTGEPLIFVGTADQDSTEYAIDANTGARVWDYTVANPPPIFGYDIGAGATVSPPGNLGVADGMVFVSSKYGVEYGLDLTTGADIWQFNMYPSNFQGHRNTIASAALDGNKMAFGYANGVFALNATSGSQLWNYVTPAEVASSPAIIGPQGSEVVAFADLTGAFRVVSLSNGTQLYSKQTGGYITSSPAVYKGSILIDSADGFLYSFVVGGSNSLPPSSTISSPANNSTVPNPNGNLTISGSSSDPTGVSGVEIAVETNGTTGKWYNARTKAWGSAPFRSAATLATPGATSTGWTFSLPVPTQGGSFKVYANTVNSGNVVDKGTFSSFTVSPSKNEPTIHTSTGFVPPAGTFTSTGNAFQPGEIAHFVLFGNVVATATVGSTGNIPQTTINVPSAAAFGNTSLTVTGVSSHKSATATIYITNDWTQFGYSAMRGATEPHDPIIAQSIDVGPNTILGLSWQYPTGAEVESSPAVVNGVAYVGNDSGVMSAVTTSSGGPLWKYTIPSHAAIRTGPAIDPSGNVIFGADDGNLYVLNSSGALVRTVAIGGKLTNPAEANDKIIAASDSGALASVSDIDGSVQWTDHLGAAIHAAPAYDAQGGVIVVGDDSGKVTAFDAGTGAQRWQVVTGGAVVSTPAIQNGLLYVGSLDGNMYALKENTGATAWKFTADSGIAGAASIGGGGNITFGTKNGSMYQVSLTGQLTFKQIGKYGNTTVVAVSGVESNQVLETFGGIIGVLRDDGHGSLVPFVYQTGKGLLSSPAIINGTVYVGAQDGNLYAFTPQGATPMSNSRAVISITDQNSWTCAAQP